MRRVLDTPVASQHVLTFFALGVVLNLAVATLAQLLVPPQPDAETLQLGLVAAVIFVSVQILGVAATLFFMGQMFEGYGSWEDCFKAAIFFNFAMLVAQLGFVATGMMLPSDAMGFPLVVVMVISVVLGVGFTMEVHGFTSPVLVFLGLLVAGLILATVLLLFIAILGIEMPASPTN
ncbi:MAG: YIP1 family protein [Pseudomonadota bacterium]